MRVLHYVDGNNLTWCESWRSLLCKLKEFGVESTVVCRPGGTLSKYLQDGGLTTIEYKPLFPALPCMAFGFASAIDKACPDIIHTRLSSAAMIGGWWGKHKNIPVASTVDKHAKMKYYWNADMILPCSRAVADHMQAQGCQSAKTEVVYNPIDLSYYKAFPKVRESVRERYSITPTVKVVVAGGRFDEGKGFESLVKAYALFLDHYKNRDGTRLWLLGDGPYRNKIEHLVKKLSIDDNVMLPGYVSNIREWFGAADLFVSPSELPEGFSVILLEAMACGLPALATNIGGSPEIVIDGVNGMFFSPGRTEELAEKLGAVLDAPDRLSMLSKEAKKSAAIFDLNAIAKQTLEVYTELVSDRARL